MKIKRKVVCFGLDDTLYYEIDFAKSAFAEISRFLEANYDIVKQDAFMVMFDAFKAKEDAIDAVLSRYSLPLAKEKLQNIYIHHKPHLVLPNSTRLLFARLKGKGAILGLITDGKSETQWNKINSLGLLRFFDKKDIIISEEFGSEKPNENNFGYFEKRYPKSEYYYVSDDTEKDFVTPNKLGWTSICLLEKEKKNIHKQDFVSDKDKCPDYCVSELIYLDQVVLGKQIEHSVKIKSGLRIQDCEYKGVHYFHTGHYAHVYEVLTFYGLNQIIGHVKFNNKQCGPIFYRGECEMHPTVLPLLLRVGKKESSYHIKNLKRVVDRIIMDDNFTKTLRLDLCQNEAEKRIVVEALLQHYGVPTRFVDFVDNHWVALWMGLNKSSSASKVNKYYSYVERRIPLLDIASGKPIDEENYYQYILLVSLPYNHEISRGIGYHDDYEAVDLRQTVPSIFLRPHAQHGLVIRKRVHEVTSIADYDMASAVVAILKIRIDRAKEWLGSGMLLSQRNLFPPPGNDHGYDILLSRPDILEDTQFSFTRYE